MKLTCVWVRLRCNRLRIRPKRTHGVLGGSLSNQTLSLALSLLARRYAPATAEPVRGRARERFASRALCDRASPLSAIAVFGRLRWERERLERDQTFRPRQLAKEGTNATTKPTDERTSERMNERTNEPQRKWGGPPEAAPSTAEQTRTLVRSFVRSFGEREREKRENESIMSSFVRSFSGARATEITTLQLQYYARARH